MIVAHSFLFPWHCAYPLRISTTFCCGGLTMRAINAASLSHPMGSIDPLGARSAAANMRIREEADEVSRTYATLLEALNRHRGKGQQKVVVESALCGLPWPRARAFAARPGITVLALPQFSASRLKWLDRKDRWSWPKKTKVFHYGESVITAGGDRH
jgi:hypothetical protein